MLNEGSGFMNVTGTGFNMVVGSEDDNQGVSKNFDISLPFDSGSWGISNTSYNISEDVTSSGLSSDLNVTSLSNVKIISINGNTLDEDDYIPFNNNYDTGSPHWRVENTYEIFQILEIPSSIASHLPTDTSQTELTIVFKVD